MGRTRWSGTGPTSGKRISEAASHDRRAGNGNGHAALVASSSSAPAEDHATRFYEGDDSLARLVAEFLHEGFDSANPGIVVGTANLRGAIIGELKGRSFDVVELQRSHNLLLVDANEILSTVMVDGRPEEQKFKRRMHKLIQSVCRDRAECTVRIFGQLADVLWQDGQHYAAIQLEMLWNQLARTETFSVLSVYALGSFYKDASALNHCPTQEPAPSIDGQFRAVRPRRKRRA